MTIQVYGVEIQVGSSPVILVDENGYTTKDHTITYMINPPEYKALTAFAVISKDGVPTTSMPTERQGKGTATISRGFWFDVNSVYETEIVLNYGTGVEIRSQKIKMAIGGIRVLDDHGEEPEQIRFGDGSKGEKRYHIELVSKVLTDSCEDLIGKLTVVDKNGEKINVPGTADDTLLQYYPSEYDLSFSLEDGRCVVKINDSTAREVLKTKFIISNLSTFDLKIRWKDKVDPNTIVVLYGGVGNRLEIEINQATREVRIEPLGVIVIGIDGLRQDVLYPGDKDNVKEPGSPYNIDVLDLPGMGQILEGYSLPEKYQSYIMLPEVTAIFPSITLATGSIFTETT
jgi:hypothetical protein